MSEFSLTCDINFDFLQKSSTENVLDKITVKFYTTDAKVFTQSFPSFYNINYIRKNLAEFFTCPEDVIGLLYKEDQIPDDTRLDQFKPDKYGILEFKLISNDRQFKIPIENAYKDLTVPDIITVHVEKDNVINEIVVEIDNKAIDKPFLGGYKDTQTGIQYHHGYTQTGPPKLKVPPEMKSHRDAQTHFTRNRQTQREHTRATQVPTRNIYLPSICDKILTAKPYESADEREKRLDFEGKVRTIQKYSRDWRMKKKLKEFSIEHQKRVRIEQEREEEERRENEERKKRDLVSKVFPMKSEDFAMLYSMVDRWKKSEIERIASMSCGAAKIAEFYLLLEKEIEILQSIDQLRNKVKKDLEIKKIMDFFKAIGSPIEWDSEYKHIHISMDTLEAQRGREFYEMYKKLTDKCLTKDERFEIYATLKQYLYSHNCSESQEIISLIDRVCELLARGMADGYITSLQKRIVSLVLHHFELPDCNEGVTNHMIKVKRERMTKNLIYCRSCQKLKPVEKFTIHARLEKMKTCKACKWLDKAEEPWIDLAPYKFILKQIRNYERLHFGKSSIAFILQDRDIHFIIVNIWHGHSALSECNDIYQLRLVRWRHNVEWAPWNCILLTAEEAKAHLKVLNLEDIYEEEFRNHIFNKHALAKKHFKNLISYDRHFAEYAMKNPKLDETSYYYNKPKKHDCLKDIDKDDRNDIISNSLEGKERKEDIEVDHDHIDLVDAFIRKRIYEDSDSDDDNDGN